VPLAPTPVTSGFIQGSLLGLDHFCLRLFINDLPSVISYYNSFNVVTSTFHSAMARFIELFDVGIKR
jgi:hypothetical protein